MADRRAFTVIELLVIVVIIALLVSVLVSSLGAARESGRRAACRSQLRNLQFALDYYARDNEDWLPCAEPEQRMLVSEQHWFMNRRLLRYVHVPVRRDGAGRIIGPPDGDSPLTCPSHANPSQTRDGRARQYGLSYAMNVTLGIGGRPDNNDYRRRSDFSRPFETLACTDANGITKALGIASYHACGKENFDYRHGGAVNVVLLDGHAESMRPEQIPFGFDQRFRSFWSAKRHRRPG